MSDPELERILQRKLQELRSRSSNEGVERKPTIITLTRENFDRVITQSKPVIVDFWAEWCGPCLVMHPIFEKLARKYGDRMVFGRLNVDLNGEIAARYQVFSIPTFLIFKNGVVVDEVVGAVGERGLEAVILKHVEE